jgi:Protein of unknown function (DUF4256)
VAAILYQLCWLVTLQRKAQRCFQHQAAQAPFCKYRKEAAGEKEGLPIAGNVLDMAAAMGIEPLTEEQYRELQKLGSFDTKTQSWLKTPSEITRLGGAIFGDRRFGRVFVYPTAPCFYLGRGFRGSLKI